MKDLKVRAQELKEAVEADEVFKNALAEAVQSGNPEKAVQLAAEKGIEFTAEEFTPAEVPDDEARELDESELEAVAGGGFWGDVAFDAACVAACLTFIIVA